VYKHKKIGIPKYTGTSISTIRCSNLHEQNEKKEKRKIKKPVRAPKLKSPSMISLPKYRYLNLC
jgi:hypothetical protein